MKTLFILILTLLFTIIGKAQPWSGTTPGNIYYNQGNVGIGTTSPGYKLDVAGTAQINNIWKFDSNGIFYWGTCYGNGLLTWDTGYASVQAQAGNSLRLGVYGYDTAININTAGNVGIGTTSPEAKLTVQGKIIASEIQVKSIETIPDYVFKSDYKLMSLNQVEDFVKLNQHLPEVPSEKEFKEYGMNMAEMNVLLLKKIEELTLYAIDQKKTFREQLFDQNRRMNVQSKKIEALEKAMNISNTK